jgi:hypothetical protein
MQRVSCYMLYILYYIKILSTFLVAWRAILCCVVRVRTFITRISADRFAPVYAKLMNDNKNISQYQYFSVFFLYF